MKAGAAVDVAQGVDAGHVGLQPLVRPRCSRACPSRTPAAARLSASVLGVRPAATSRCEPRQRALALRRPRTVKRESCRPSSRPDSRAGGCRAAPRCRPRAGSRRPPRRRPRPRGQQLRAALHDGDGAAEAAEHLPELQPDVAAAQHQQVLGHRVQFHDRGGVQHRHGRPALEVAARPGARPVLMKIVSARDRARRAVLKPHLAASSGR